MANYKVIDADGHVRESNAGMREFLQPRWQRRNFFPTTSGIATCMASSGKSPKARKISWPPWTKTASTSW